MKLEHSINIKLSEQEVIEAILGELECKMNDEVPGTEKLNKLEGIIKSARENKAAIEFDDDGDFVMIIGGVAIEESL